MTRLIIRYNEQKNCIDETVYEARFMFRLDCEKCEEGLKQLLIHRGSLMNFDEKLTNKGNYYNE